MPDILIRGGRIVDGTGETWYRGDVAIDGDTVTIHRGQQPGVDAGQVIDATGMVVCPGFIDMHSHSEMSLLSNPDHEPKLRQGVTTEVIGVDGLSYAPITPTKLEPILTYLSAVNGKPPEGVQWGSVAEFLSLFDGRSSANVAYFVPHMAVRVEAMGWEARLPNEGEMRQMQRLVREGMRDGAFGFSTGLTYTPGAYSDTEELVDLTMPIKVFGGIYVTHARYTLGDRLLDPFREALTIGRRTGVPVQISHYHSPVNGMGEQMVALVEEGRNSDVDVTYDQYPYPASSTVLHSLLPYWVHAGGPDAMLQRIATQEVREQIADAIDPMWGGSMDNYIFSRVGSSRNREWEGRSVTDMARAQGKSMVDTVCDLLIEERMEVAFVARTGNPDNIRAILRHPAQMVGSDGLLTGDHPNPRSYGTYPYVLGQMVREEGILRLEDAVRKMTALPAQRLGLKDRGILRDGMKADLVVFNPDTVRATATFEDPKQFPVGIDHVLVNGQPVISNGAHTGAHPGRALRRV